MRRFLSLLTLCVFLALAWNLADADISNDADEEVLEEILDVEPEVQENDMPQLTAEAFEKIMSKVSAKCQKEAEANPSDPSQLSERCRNEIAHKVQRFIARQTNEKDEDKKSGAKASKAQKKPKKKKSKKATRAQREASEALKKDQEYHKTLQVIIGFVGTLIALAVGAMCVINRKLKAAGMYYPADPDAKANCCG